MLFGRRSGNDEPDSVLLSGYESDDHFRDRQPDWESEADDVRAAVAQALAWIGDSERQVEVIEARGRSGRVVALVAAAGTEWIDE
jgi:hypothetical protein